jgi:tRNA nucleotidyltransferase (CCA-adding enzyme)
MQERLPGWILNTLKNVGEVAEMIGFPAYVVGGFVRDLFLYRANMDLDVVIEGDGIAFARRFAETVGARIHTHAKFGTAVIIYPDNFKIDVASARMEYYKFPAALPIVETSSIKLDLYRRDFTVNTLAVQLNPNRFGILIDFFGGQKDIKERVIRVLHNLSFVEDPTRVFRAIRFEQRFGFSIGKLTAGLIQNAVKMDFFKRLSGRRVFSELRQLLEEDNPTPAIIRMQEYDLLKTIHPSIEINKDLISLFNSIKKVLAWYDLLFLEESYMKWAVYFQALVRTCDRNTSMDICRRFELPPRHRKVLVDMRLEADRRLVWLENQKTIKNSRLYRQLIDLKLESILFIMAATRKETVKKRISLFITQQRDITLAIGGSDLKRAGLTPGPVYRKILDQVLDAKLDGQIRSPADEYRWVEDYLERHRLKPSGP